MATPRVSAGDAWYACYTHPRCEKKAREQLQKRGIETYLPIVPLERKWHDRKKVVDWPLYPSYVFVCFEWASALTVLSTPGIVDVVRFGSRPAAIAEDEIQNLVRFVNALGITGLEPPRVRFIEGQRVRLISGPFQNVEGIVREVRSTTRLVVGLQTIGSGFEINVPSDSVQAIGGRVDVGRTRSSVA